MRYQVFVRSPEKPTEVLHFDDLRKAATFIADECEECASVWDKQKQRWVTGAELLLAAVTSGAQARWKRTGF